MTDNDTFDTADVDDVQQRDDEYTVVSPDVPVCVKNRVQTEGLPTILGPCKNYIIEAAGRAVRILDRNERRAKATIMVTNGDICVGSTPGEAGDGGKYVGGIISGGLAVPSHYGFASEMWARGVFVDVSGTAIVLSDTTDAVMVTVIEEFWTR